MFKTVECLERMDDLYKTGIILQIFFPELGKTVHGAKVAERLGNKSIEDGEYVWVVLTTILGGERIIMMKSPFDSDISHFIDERNIPVGNPLVRVEFDDSFCKFKPVINVRAVIRIQHRHFCKHFGKIVVLWAKFVI